MKSSTNYLRLLFLSLTVSALFLYNYCSAQTPLFYGMTLYGGSNNKGAIIQFNPSTNTDSVVWNLGGTSDGYYPSGNLAFDPVNGLFYGMTNEGGTNNLGAIVSFNPVTNAENVVWNFGNGNDGQAPTGDLVYDSNSGLFYGLTLRGGSNINGYGTIISFDPAINRDSVLWTFGKGVDGYNPYGNLVYDPVNGLYYAMTFGGGSINKGAIISFNPATNKDSSLWSFGTGLDGASPNGNLTYDPVNGLFYGMTLYGGDNSNGTIISFDPTTNIESLLWKLGSGTDGARGPGSLVYDAGSGLFYGMTEQGGTNTTGTIFSFNTTTNRDSVLWNLGGSGDARQPLGSLVYDVENGLYYGMTNYGGSNDKGAILSFDPTTNTETLVWNFGNGTDGRNPQGTLVLYPASVVTGTNAINDTSVNIFPNPVSDILNVRGLSNGQVVEVYNYSGQMVNRKTAGNMAEQVNLSSLANGIYRKNIK